MLQLPRLLSNPFRDLGMAVSNTDCDYSCEGIQVTASFFVKDVLHMPLYDHEGLPIVSNHPRTDILLSQGKDFIDRRAIVGFGLEIEDREFQVFGGACCGTHGCTIVS